MAYDLLSLPTELISLDDVPPELVAMYEEDADGMFTLTAGARENIGKVGAGINQLAQQRDEAAAKAQTALVEQAVMGAVLSAGASGRMAGAASALFTSQESIVTRNGVLVVETDGGEVPLRDAIAEFMRHGEGQVFLPSAKPPEQENHFLNQVRRFR